MKSLTIKLIAALILTLAVALPQISCSSKVVKREIVEVHPDSTRLHAFAVKSDSPEQKKLDQRAYGFYVNGLLAEGIGDYYSAVLNYQKALKHFPESQTIGLAYAHALFQLKELTKSLAVLQQLKPQDSEVLMLTAGCYHALGMPDSVHDVYLKLVRLDPDNSMAFSYLVGYYRQRQDLDSTIWAYDHLIRLRPEHYRHLNEQAQLLAKRKDYERARQLFHRSIALESGPSNTLAIIALGELYIITEKPDSAITVFKQGLEEQPDNTLLHRELIDLYVKSDSLRAALPHARKVADLMPDDPFAQRRLGILYFSVNATELADSVFTSLVSKGDRNSANHFYLGRIAALNDDWQRARDEFTLLTQLADSLFGSWLDLGLACRRLGRPDEEIQTYQTGLNHMRDEASALSLYFALGAAYERNGRYEEAVETFEEIITHNPDHAESLNYLGYMLADAGERLEYARDLISRAVELAPRNAAFLDSYGWVYYRLGDYEKALKYLQQAVALDFDPIMFDHLGDAHQALGDTDEARRWWQKALEQQPDNEKIKDKLGR